MEEKAEEDAEQVEEKKDDKKVAVKKEDIKSGEDTDVDQTPANKKKEVI
jgi:hypothetical protein